MRSCDKRLVTARLLSKDGDLLSEGENICMLDTCGRPDAVPGERYDLCNAIHAEEIAILDALALGRKLYKAVMYVDYAPCRHCRAMMRLYGIRWITVKGDEDD